MGILTTSNWDKTEMKLKELFEAKAKPMPKMGIPGVKVTVLQEMRSKLEAAIKSLGHSIEFKGYSDGSTSWSVAFYVKKNFNIDKFETDLRKKLDVDGWIEIEWFDLEEK